jgi:hypothetical protein
MTKFQGVLQIGLRRNNLPGDLLRVSIERHGKNPQRSLFPMSDATTAPLARSEAGLRVFCAPDTLHPFGQASNRQQCRAKRRLTV